MLKCIYIGFYWKLGLFLLRTVEQSSENESICKVSFDPLVQQGYKDPTTNLRSPQYNALALPIGAKWIKTSPS